MVPDNVTVEIVDGAGHFLHLEQPDVVNRRDRRVPHVVTDRPPLPDGLVAVVKRDCPTCLMVVPVLAELARGPEPLTVYTQDDPTFPAGAGAASTTPTSPSPGTTTSRPCRRCCGSSDGEEVERTVGLEPRRVGGAHRRRPGSAPTCRRCGPGCGSLRVDPDLVDELRRALRRRRPARPARRAGRARGRGRGAVRPGLDRRPAGRAAHRGARAADARRARPARRTRSSPSCRPTSSTCTVEKVAINAVMAGCRPEYLPWVLAAVEAVCTDEFNIHGVLATTMPVGPVIIVQRAGHARHRHEQRRQRARPGQPGQLDDRPGAAARRPQRRRRPAGRGRPGHARQPGQVSVLLRRGRGGLAVGRSLAEPRRRAGRRRGHRVRRRGPARASSTSWPATPEALAARSPRACGPCTTRSCVLGFDAILVVGPEHARVFAEAGWDRERVARRAARARCSCPGSELVHGAGGIAEGVPESLRRRHAAQVPRRRAAARPRRRRRRPVLGHHRRLGQRGRRQRSPVTREVRSDEAMSAATSRDHDPARPDRRAHRRRAAARCPGRPSLDGPTRRAARHLQAPGRRLPRPARGAPRPTAGVDGPALPQADLHQAGAGRPAPRDRHEVRAW